MPDRTIYKVLDLSEFNIPDESVDLSSCTFKDYTFDELDRMYFLRFSIPKEFHPDRELSHDDLCIYFKAFQNTLAGMDIISELNTLNYTTSGRAKITVSANGNFFAPISDETLMRTAISSPISIWSSHLCALLPSGFPKMNSWKYSTNSWKYSTNSQSLKSVK